MNYISETEFKEYNPEIDFSAYGATTISGMISRASKIVDNFLGYSLGIEDITNEIGEAIVTSDGDLQVWTSRRPIVSVSSISLKLGEYEVALTLSSEGNNYYDIPKGEKYILYPYQEIEMTGKMSLNSLFQLRDRQVYIKTSYRAGYEIIPYDIKDAVNIIARQIFQRQNNATGAKSMSQGNISVSFGNTKSIPDEASEILMNYKRIIPV